MARGWLWLAAALSLRGEARITKATRRITLSGRELLQEKRNRQTLPELYGPLSDHTCAKHLCPKHLRLVSAYDARPPLQRFVTQHQVGNNSDIHVSRIQLRHSDNRVAHAARRLRLFARRVHGRRIPRRSRPIFRNRRGAGTDGNQRVVSTARRPRTASCCSRRLGFVAINKQNLARTRRPRSTSFDVVSATPSPRPRKRAPSTRRVPRADLLLQAQSWRPRRDLQKN